jgi:hypothetical protein
MPGQADAPQQAGDPGDMTQQTGTAGQRWRPRGPASDTAGEGPQPARYAGPRDHLTMSSQNGEFCAQPPV